MRCKTQEEDGFARSLGVDAHRDAATSGSVTVWHPTMKPRVLVLRRNHSSGVLIRALAADRGWTFAEHDLAVDGYTFDVVAGWDVEHDFEHHAFED